MWRLINVSLNAAIVGVMIMGVPIRIDEELFQEAKDAAAAEFRTAPLQIQYWARVGKAALDNPDLPIEFIRDILISKGQPSEPFAFEE